jgi:hypothetical protein
MGVAICAAERAYYLAAVPERPTQFTAGTITWRNASKNQDYALLLGLLGGFAAAWIALSLLDRRVEARLGTCGVRTARALFAYMSLPLVVWVTAFVLTPGYHFEMVWLSAAGVAVAYVLMLAASGRGTAQPRDVPGDAVAAILLLLGVLGALSALIGAFATNRLSGLLRGTFVWIGSPPSWSVAGAGGLAAVALGAWAALSDEKRQARRLQVVVSLSQLILPWAFLMVMPTPWLSANIVQYPYETANILGIGLALTTIGTIDVVRRMPRFRREQVCRPLTAVSPAALAAALFFLKFGPAWVGYHQADDYHAGELLLPWWSMATHGAVPFWDYVPSRGLINYVPGGIASLVYDGRAADVTAASALVAGVVLMVGVTSLGWVIGPLPAAAAFLMMPISNPLSHIDILNTAGLSILWATYTRLSSTAWLCVWVATGSVLFMAAPAQGAAVIIATLPLGVWRFAGACREERRPLLNAAAAALAIVVVMWLATPAELVVRGAVRYAVEHSAVGDSAHAVDWRLSAGAPTPLNWWLWEAVRTAWIAVGCAAGALIAWTLLRGDRERRAPLLLVGVPVLLLAVAFIYRAAGRIDPGMLSRLGLTTSWMVCLLLPVLLYAAWGNERWPAIITMTVVGGGLIAAVIEPIRVATVLGRPFETLPAPAGADEAARSGLPGLDRTAVPAADLSRLLAIDAVLDVLLEPDETYLDLTNRNAQYFYLDRRVPIESGAPYNLPDDHQQRRAVAALEAQKIPAVLAGPDRMLFDSGPPSYRSYAIYRYLMWRFVPARINGLVFLVRPDRLARVLEHLGERADLSDPASLLDTLFRQANLLGLPGSWGGSWPALQKLVLPVRQLDVASSVPLHLDATGAGAFRVAGATPAVRWDLATAPLRGKDAGLLTFQFVCLSGSGEVPLEVAWAPAGESIQPVTTVRFTSAPKVAVPLDAAPRWLLARSIHSLQISVAEPNRCPEFSIADVRLWQRRVAAVTDPY